MDNDLIKEIGKQTVIPLYGTTIYIGEVPLDTVYGKFAAKTFQDTIHKGYIVSLVFGDLKASPLYIRMHSSCITSECLRSMDCDCVQQLEGAMQKISEKGNGILFYLMQEGRGCGYVAKSRDRMLVQCLEGTESEITTFEAYKKMGMKKDYRDYRNIKDICHILNIMDKEFVLITNNPDKIQGFKDMGLNLNRIESIDISPGPFNIAYLKSKQQSGHLIFQTKKKQPSFYNIPYEKIKPFEPFAIKDLQRFILVAAYYLPIKPIAGKLYFNKKQYDFLMSQIEPVDKAQLQTQLVGSRYFVQFPNYDMIKKYGQLTVKPWWFKVHVFYDVGHSTDYIVMTHDMDISEPDGIQPVVRIQSESIFDRFPLKTKQYKERYKETLKAIVRRGKGLIMILYNDGRGTGLGHRILDMEGIQSGISPEHRDFDAVCRLLKVFVKDQPFELYGGLTSYGALMLSMANNGLNPSSYHLFAKGAADFKKVQENRGIESLKSRIRSMPQYLANVGKQLASTEFPTYSQDDIVYTTGVGTSEAHARFLSHIIPRFKFKTIQEIGEIPNLQSAYIILFSQGLSPNIGMIVDKCNIQKLTVVTTIHENAAKKDRVATLKKLQQEGAKFIIYKEEMPDDTLVRVQGPAAGYLVALHFKNSIDNTRITYVPRYQKPSQGLIKEFITKKQVMFVLTVAFLPLVSNIAMKFLEGAFSEPAVFCDQISFSHGYFQYALNKKIPIVFVGDVRKLFKNFVEKNCLSEKLETSGLMTLLDLEVFCNQLMIQYIEHYKVDQINWSGKQKDKDMYDIRKFSEL